MRHSPGADTQCLVTPLPIPPRRFYDPQVGQVLLNGAPAADYTRGEWAKAVALVSQEPVLFAGTIADNIAYGRWGRVNQADVVAAAQAANVHEFVDTLPEGYDTVVGDRGTLLSGESASPCCSERCRCHLRWTSSI